jgi:hypothetical protein
MPSVQAGTTFGVRKTNVIQAGTTFNVGAPFLDNRVLSQDAQGNKNLQAANVPWNWAGDAFGCAETLPRWAPSVTLTTTIGQLRLWYLTPTANATVTTFYISSGAAGAGGGVTFARLGLYTVDPSTGDLTLVAASLSDTALLSVPGTDYAKSFDSGGGLPTSYQLVASSRYAIGLLVLGGSIRITVTLLQGTTLPPLNAGSLAGQTNLPTTLTAASLTPSGGLAWVGLK